MTKRGTVGCMAGCYRLQLYGEVNIMGIQLVKSKTHGQKYIWLWITLRILKIWETHVFLSFSQKPLLCTAYPSPHLKFVICGLWRFNLKAVCPEKSIIGTFFSIPLYLYSQMPVINTVSIILQYLLGLCTYVCLCLSIYFSLFISFECREEINCCFPTKRFSL